MHADTTMPLLVGFFLGGATLAVIAISIYGTAIARDLIADIRNERHIKRKSAERFQRGQTLHLDPVAKRAAEFRQHLRQPRDPRQAL